MTQRQRLVAMASGLAGEHFKIIRISCRGLVVMENSHQLNNFNVTCKKKAKASSYLAQYPVLGTVQSALHFASLTDLFTQTPSRLLWEASSHMLQLMREGCSCTYPSLSIARYSFIQLSELEQCRVKKLAQGQDSNPGSRNRESEALPLSHCVYKRHFVRHI